MGQQHPAGPPAQTNALSELDPERLPSHTKKYKDDWWVVFNPAVARVLDVDLVHTLQHESVVCCVRFSADGKYVATGCNRSAQIYDVASGEKICILQDESIDLNGDLYIRSVCFSPDGKYLATGAEDKLIRVCLTSPLLLKALFSVMLTQSGLGYCCEADQKHFPRSRAGHLLTGFRP
jgi:glucose repression regulatory protein TUP1